VAVDTDEDLRLLRQLVARVGPDASMQTVLRALGHTSALVVLRRL
jgi:hypothetical protein